MNVNEAYESIKENVLALNTPSVLTMMLAVSALRGHIVVTAYEAESPYLPKEYGYCGQTADPTRQKAAATSMHNLTPEQTIRLAVEVAKGRRIGAVIALKIATGGHLRVLTDLVDRLRAIDLPPLDALDDPGANPNAGTGQMGYDRSMWI